MIVFTYPKIYIILLILRNLSPTVMVDKVVDGGNSIIS